MTTCKLIPVGEWAKNLMGEFAPHPNTLRNWVHGGKISPQPVRMGLKFFVREDARYIDPQAERRERILRGR